MVFQAADTLKVENMEHNVTKIIKKYDFVSDFWRSGLIFQAADALKTGASFQDLPCMPASCLLPKGMTALQFMHINTAAALDLEHVKQVMEDLEAAIRCLQISEAQLIVSLVSSKL